MTIKGISRRWLLNSLGIILTVLVVVIISFALIVRGYYYNGIKEAITGRSGVVTNALSQNSKEFQASARDYVENFPEKERMELMVYNYRGDVILTSTGFDPDTKEKAPDFEEALKSDNGMATWTGRISSGENVMAVTQVVHGPNETVLGAIRYVVSLQLADRQIATLVAALLLIGMVVIFFVIMSSFYFIKSILMPVREMGATAKRIAHGDFDARINKPYDDEIGDLCDTINYMAGELGAAEKMKNDFISSVSHELRTPLTAIKGWAETLQGGDPSDRVTVEKGMRVIIRESERLSGIVEELLDFSRMQNGRMTLMLDKIDILAELGEAVYMFTDRAAAEKKFLVYEEPTMLPPVLGDINRLRQVFVNILDNALKYTAEGGTITVSAQQVENVIKVVISDNGCGIAPEHIAKVKNKFYKANQTQRGSGIGLAVADEIMQLHSGSLDIESEEGVGTAVTITIPVLPKAEEPAALQELQSEEERNSGEHE